MIEERLTRLPRWAAERIVNAERRVVELNAIIRGFSADSDSGITYRPTADIVAQNLPDCDVTFRLAGERPGAIEIALTADRDCLRVASSHMPIRITPVASNVIYIWEER